MESHYTTNPSALSTLSNQLHSRQKHILFLQSELLRVDYEYGIIIKQLKQKYEKLYHKQTQHSIQIKQIKKQNRRLYEQICRKQQEIERYKQQIEKLKDQIKEYLNSIKLMKSQNQGYKQQMRVMEGNNSKISIKLVQANDRKQQYKREMQKWMQRSQQQQKHIKKLQIRNKQLQQLVQQQLQQTQHRIQSITTQYLTKTQPTTPPPLLADSIGQVNPESTMKNFGRVAQKQGVNDWQSDMRKLKNCVDYGAGYLLVFDAMNLDRNISRQIFLYIKNLTKTCKTLQQNLHQQKQHSQQTISEYKKMLQHFQHELHQLQQSNKTNTNTNTNTKITIDTQIQTQNIQSQYHDFDKVIQKVNQLNFKLKLKNNGLGRAVGMLVGRVVVMGRLIMGGQQSGRYWRELAMGKKQEAKCKQRKGIDKLRPKIQAIIFIKYLQKLIKSRQQTGCKQVSSVGKSKKIRSETLKLLKNNQTNVELEKLKQTIGMMDQTQLYARLEDVVAYQEFKAGRSTR